MKAFEILQSFQKKDWHWFKKYLLSPIFNKNESIIRIFNFFLAQKTNFKKETFSENLFQYTFPDESFDAAKMHYASNYFFRAAEDYLALDEWQQNKEEQLLYLLSAYRKRGLEKHFKTTHHRLQELHDLRPERNPQHYRFSYQLALEDYQQSMQLGRSGAEQLQPLSDWHDVAFVAEKLKNACILLSRRKLLRTDFDTGLLSAVLAFVKARPLLMEFPAIAVYYYGFMTLNEPENEAHFFALKLHLAGAQKQFPLLELRDIYLLAVNFCINRINLRQNDYLKEVLDLYQSGLEAQVFLENGQISRFTYTNITLVALRGGEFGWVQRFLEKYRDKLPEHQRQGTYAFNLARYYCEKGDYDRAMPLLQEMDFDDVLHNLVAKTMLLRMYFETGEHNALASLLDSLDSYLRRKRLIGEQQQTAYRNTVRFVRKLMALKPGHHKARLALRQEMAATPLLAEKEWLIRAAQA
jgi:hypothetical protein